MTMQPRFHGYTVVVSDDAENRKLNTLVGEAIKALAESGAEAEFIGAFAASHRVKVADILGHTVSAPSQPPDLVALVKEVLDQVLSHGQFRARKARKSSINVVIGGKRTSLTVSPDLLKDLVEAKGNKAAARAAINELTETMPPGTANRSAWIESRLQAVLALGQDESASQARH